MQQQAYCWRTIAGVDDVRAAQLIHADAIDILVDLSDIPAATGWAYSRANPRRYKSGYLGYLNTSGIAAMDYRITDASADPPGASDRLHSETLLRLPQTLWCYQPPEDAPSVAPPPAQRSGYSPSARSINVAKLHDRVLKLWPSSCAGYPPRACR